MVRAVPLIAFELHTDFGRSGPGWVYEIKHDSFRLITRRDDAGVRLIRRNGTISSNVIPRLPRWFIDCPTDPA
jgi:ATP-dependent DNA ligase